MSDVIEARRAATGPRSVQDDIDELPAWSDGTSLKSAPMTTMQWRIWGLAAAGKFFEGYVVFMTGVALPLIVREFQIGAAEKGTCRRVIFRVPSHLATVRVSTNTPWSRATLSHGSTHRQRTTPSMVGAGPLITSSRNSAICTSFNNGVGPGPTRETKPDSPSAL